MNFNIRKMTDLHRLAIAYLISIVIFQMVFFLENPINVIKTVTTLFWLFIVPGIGITYLWKLNFTERFVLSVVLGSAVVVITTYYLGIFGVHVNISSLVVPAFFTLIGLLVIFRDKLISIVKQSPEKT